MDLPTSQTSSHYPLEPVSADILAGNEKKRRDRTRLLGPCRTGCAEVDEYVLLGGMERGCVVGVSAEEEDLGVLLALQAVAHSWLDGSVRRAMVVTPKSASWAAGTLRDAIKAQLSAAAEDNDESVVKEKLAKFLDAAMISCVFDVDGLWEVLADLDPPPAKDAEAAAQAAAPVPNTKTDGAPGTVLLEVGDSEDEGSSPPSPTPPKEKATTTSIGKDIPDVIVVTHLSTLLGGLFAQREKSAAHAKLQMLSSYIRYLSRSLPSQPLIMLLNSTTTADGPGSRDAALQQQPQQQRTKGNLDPTLRSVFNPPPLDLPGYAPLPASRRNKPTFGLVFSQFLDLHILCTRIPKTKEDADVIFGGNLAADQGQVSFVTVVEVLLDDMGVWEGELGPRRSREQRWGVVDVRGGRIEDAFRRDEKMYKDIRIVAGFGGPRV